MPTIAVTGAGGFIGSHVVRRFAGRGWRVLALVRDPSLALPDGAETLRYDLEAQPPPLAGVDWLVHCAYVAGREAVNIDGARRLVEALRSAGTGRALLLSSIAARPGTDSAYGRHKLASEPLFDVSLRPGLVIGDGGLLRDTVRFMRRRRLVPLVSGGRQPLQTIAIDDVVTAIEHAIDGGRPGVYTLADPRPTTYRDVYRAIASALGLRVLFVPVPYRLLEAALRAAAAARVDVGVDVDNLRGLRSARHVDTTGDLRRLGLELEPLEAALRRLLGPLSSGAS